MIPRSRRLFGSSPLSIHRQQSQHEGYAPVTVDTRALIDKVLARYSGEFTVFRELLQNSDDAGCDAAEIRFETAAFLPLKPGAAMKAGSPMLPDLKTTNVERWTFKNHGKPFTKEDWDRLPKIALGNPDPQKVGAFGVGFYSLFSVTESPYVSSGDKEMEFSWKGNQLCYRFGGLPQTATSDPWTTFKMPLREAAPMPSLSEFMQFLASSITFMVHLKDVTVFFDHHRLGQITKSLRRSLVTPIPPELKRSSPEKNMTVKSVRQHRKSFRPVTITAEVIHPPCDSTWMHETKVDLVVFTAEVDVSVEKKLFKELNRCMKKDPPSHLKYSLIYTGKDEYDQSCINEQKHPLDFPFPFRGLRADLDRATHTRVFIGHATAQTTGMGGHMASYFIPTVERESIDLADRNVAVWNRELLYVGGFLCRTVYELELSKIQKSWEEAEAGESQSRKMQDQRFLHLLKFFTFHHSTPSSKVTELLANSFHGCSILPLMVLSSVGVRGAPDVRRFDSELAKFLKSLPMLSEDVTRDCACFLDGLPDEQKICTITPEDVLQDLRHHALHVEELVICLRWWINSGRKGVTTNMADLLDAATLRGTRETIHLSSITFFVDPKVLGPHIPPNGPLPPSLIPLGISKNFNYEELTSFRWKEFTVVAWLQHISHTDVMSADEEYDFTRSVDWARLVLSTLCRVWPKLSEDMRSGSREVFRSRSCIPTSKGLCYPEHSYLPIAENALLHHLDLPIISHHSRFKVDEDMKEFLLSIGVRKNPPVQFLLNRMLPTGDWTVHDLVSYLVQQGSSLSSEDLSVLESAKIFLKESVQSSEENTHHCVRDLYPPVDIFRKLQLPIIKWSKKSEWRDTTPEARLLYRLGLNRFPPLPNIVELCASSNDGLQETAFAYLCDRLHSQYADYNPESFRNVEFIPAESKDRSCLRKLGEVFSGTQWKALGFYVVRDGYSSALLHQLGVMQHPPTSELLNLLEKAPPPDEKSAIDWFEALSGHLATPDLAKLSGVPIVPTGPSSALKMLPPAKCYLHRGPKPVLYAKLFIFVDFGSKANHFLSACGSKNQVSTEDVAGVLIENPGRFFELAEGYEGWVRQASTEVIAYLGTSFLVELRKLAYHRQDISNVTLDKMSHSPSLLGMRRKKTQGQVRWDYEYRFLPSQEVTIVDDMDDYQLFHDCLFVAPQEEVLERFYKRLGCSYLSDVVMWSCNDLHEIPATKTCPEVRSLILERLPLFIQNYTDIKPEDATSSSPDRLRVKACKRIVVTKILVAGNVKRTGDAQTIARRQGDFIELWISEAAKCDMYEVAASLCRLLFGGNKMNATVLGAILSADLAFLERRGFLAGQIFQQHENGYGEGNEKKKECSAGSASTTNSPQQSTLDTQVDPQLKRERLPGGSAASPQSPSLSQIADGVPRKIHEVSDVSSGEPFGVPRHPTSVSVPRTSHEVIPQSDIRNIVKKAIKASSFEGKGPVIREETGRCLSNAFCSMPAGCLRHIGEVKNVHVFVDEVLHTCTGVPDAETFMNRKHGPLSRFVNIIISLSEIYGISTTMLRVFYDLSGGRIAFNCGGTIYFNLRYFEVWHDDEVKKGCRENAQKSWFLALAHEVAHNLTDQHNSDHEFWFSAICEAHFGGLSRLLRPANACLRCMLWLTLIVTVILFAYPAISIAPVINVPH
ncbi:hypothetical protein F5141DRAFT_1295920 [Pisolithus sp. B1]|nr:hypothetical protein F5141DRAFT_1295920 [Pisolithus sp. B1]